jgi:hypothetical protein
MAYTPAASTFEFNGGKFDVRQSNVFLISNINIGKVEVTPLGIHNLDFSADDLPPIVLLQRDADIWSALSGHPAADHATRKLAVAAQKSVSEDQAGLALMKSQQPEDQRRGCDLMQQAADAGYAPSQYRYGYCFQAGVGRKQDLAMANDWYAKSAAQGFVDAEYKLAYSYETGRGTAKDPSKALEWYTRAGDSGDAEALYNLALIYEKGVGVPANLPKAIEFLERAASAGDIESQVRLAQSFSDGADKNAVTANAWALVLEAEKSRIDDASWPAIQSVIADVRQKDGSADQVKVNSLAGGYMTAISDHEMMAYSQVR